MFVITNVAEPIAVPVHTPLAVRDGGMGVLVGVLVGVKVSVGVKVGVTVGRSRQEPVTLSVTDESRDVL